MFELDNQVAVVIGGDGGLGAGCVAAMAKQGAKVIVASYSPPKRLQDIAKKIKTKTGSDVAVMQCDVTNEDSIAKLVANVVINFGTVDILVNAMGINMKVPSVDIDANEWDRLFATNVRGVVLSCKHFGKHMISKKKGKIINFSSVRGIRGAGGGNTMYGATKGAVDMITRMLAAEWAKFNINVNAVGPSTVRTEMMTKSVPAKRLAALEAATLFKRFATAEDVAAACVYLASSEADYITGQIMYVDGGLTAIG